MLSLLLYIGVRAFAKAIYFVSPHTSPNYAIVVKKKFCRIVFTIFIIKYSRYKRKIFITNTSVTVIFVISFIFGILNVGRRNHTKLNKNACSRMGLISCIRLYKGLQSRFNEYLYYLILFNK